MQTDNLATQHSIPYIGEGLTKKQIEQLATLSVEDVRERGNVFQVAEAISCIEQFARAVKGDERFVEYLRDELLKNKGRITTASGARIEACETGTSYDYSLHEEWCKLNKEIESLTEKRKALEDKLKKIPAGLALVDPDGGEMLLIGPARSSKSSYKVTLAR